MIRSSNSQKPPCRPSALHSATHDLNAGSNGWTDDLDLEPVRGPRVVVGSAYGLARFNAAQAKSIAKLSPAVYSASATPPLNHLMPSDRRISV